MNLGRRGQGARGILCALIVLAAAGPASAADWSIKGSLSQRVSGDDNPNLDLHSPGFVFGSLTDVSVDIQALTRTSRLNLTGDLGYRYYTGKGSDELTNRFVPNAGIRYEKDWKRDVLTAEVNYALEDASDLNFTEIGPNLDKGDRQTISGNVSVLHKVNARNDLTFAVGASDVTYKGVDDADPYRLLSPSISWLNRQTRLTDFRTTLGVDIYDYDDPPDTLNYMYYLREDVNTRLSKRLRVNAGAGVRLLDTYADNLLLPGTPRDHSTSIGGLANAGFEYALKETNFSGGVDYGLNPSTDGKLVNQLNFSLGVQHRINDYSTIGLSTSYTLSGDPDGHGFNEKTLSISPTYTYRFTEYWRMVAGYQFILQREDGQTAKRNYGYVTIARDFVLLP
ncbi:hypothetical protein [Aestuariivirga sp.]|uniref:hypothetical protein n=1 Tax=Aestuariivirga sp. TaxID=2650926 RepID=UPI0039E23D1E